jgi:putative dimethyl sulfoxide reductase chaperone
MAKELSKILALLSNLYLCRPTKEAVENWKALLSENWFDPLSELKEAIDNIDLNSEQELEDLLWEYTRLFIGPYKLLCPPWESVYMSPKRLMMQEACDEVVGVYAEMGLAIDNPDVMPDHIGVELNFLAVLHGKMMSDQGGTSSYVDTAKRFLDEHLLRWVPQFTIDMEEAADSALYKSLAEVTRIFIMAECDHSDVESVQCGALPRHPPAPYSSDEIGKVR